MRFGANYTPRLGWFHSWLDLDLEQVRRDFDQLAGIGLDHVRVFPLWPLLQPNRTLIRRQGLDDVAAVVGAAHGAGLQVVVDVLQGHLSSFDFLPSWVTSWHRGNLFTDERIVGGQRELVLALGERLRDEAGMLGLSVGNEFIQFAAGRHPFRHQVTTGQAKDWLVKMLDAARTGFPGGVHTHSYDDDLFFDETHPFTPELATTLGEMTTVHAWVFGRLGPHIGRDAPQLAWFARYLCELALAWSNDPGRQVWLQEIGAPSNYVSAEKSSEFVTSTLAGLADLPELWGVTWWCSHDVNQNLADFPELEHSLGLFDAEGVIKPSGRALAEFIADHRPGSKLVHRTGLVFDDTDLSAARVATRPDGELFGTWASLAASGQVPTLVPLSRAAGVGTAGCGH